MQLPIIITAPSLNPLENISGISEVVRFIINNNSSRKYIHFLIGKKDTESDGKLHRIFSLWKTYQRWKKLLGQERNAIIHYNFPLNAKSIIRDYFFIQYALNKRRKIIVHIHGGIYLSSLNRPWFVNYLLKKIFSSSASFIVLSESEKHSIQSEFQTKNIKVLPNCVDLKEALSFKRAIKNEKEPLNLGYIGRIEVNKGMDWLLKACLNLKNNNIPFNLNIAGKEEQGNSYIEEFKKTLGSSFKYHGVVHGLEKDKFLRSLDLFLLPSFFEGLPVSLLECMSFGVVPIVTPVGSIPEIVEDNQNGLLIKLKDDESITKAVIKLHSNRELLYTMSQNSRSSIFSLFSPEKYIEKLELIYTE